MGRRPTVLFVGTFLSASSGTMGISEKIMEALDDAIVTKCASSFDNKVLRMAHIVWAVLFSTYNVLHVDVFSGMAFRIAQTATWLGKLNGKKVVLALRGGNLPSYVARHPQRVARVLERADVIHTPSQMLRDFVASRYRVDISYLPNFVDVSRFQYHHDSYKPFSLLWVRAFAEIYNPEAAVEILEKVRAVYPEATLTMVGPDKGKLGVTMNLIADRGLEMFVRIVGPVSNHELPAYYHGHEVFLNTTSYESFGVAVLEAACCGIPIVSYNVGEIPYLWKSGEEILLADFGDVDRLAMHVMSLFSDQERARRQSHLARKKAEQFSWEHLRSQWLEVLKE